VERGDLMFPMSPSHAASILAVMVGFLLTFGFAIIWIIFAATLVVTMVIAVHRSIPRSER
jgi:uncharacterized membrane protein